MVRNFYRNKQNIWIFGIHDTREAFTKNGGYYHSITKRVMIILKNELPFFQKLPSFVLLETLENIFLIN